MITSLVSAIGVPISSIVNGWLGGMECGKNGLETCFPLQ